MHEAMNGTHVPELNLAALYPGYEAVDLAALQSGLEAGRRLKDQLIASRKAREELELRQRETAAQALSEEVVSLATMAEEYRQLSAELTALEAPPQELSRIQGATESLQARIRMLVGLLGHDPIEKLQAEERGRKAIERLHQRLAAASHAQDLRALVAEISESLDSLTLDQADALLDQVEAHALAPQAADALAPLRAEVALRLRMLHDPTFAARERDRLAAEEQVPNDQGGVVKLAWSRSPLDAGPISGGAGRITEYRIWRHTNVQLGSNRPQLVGLRTAHTRKIGEYYWEEIGTQRATGLTGYSFTAKTLSDSVAGGNARSTFMVEARASAENSSWFSPPDSGYSVDNLPPYAPQFLDAIFQNSTLKISWRPVRVADLAFYRVYRGVGAEFQIGPGTRLAEVADTVYRDPLPSNPQVWSYKITAVDIHGNEGPPLILRMGNLIGTPVGGQLAAYALAAFPSPSRGASYLKFYLPEHSAVALDLLGTDGRLLAHLADEAMEPGVHTVPLEFRGPGREPLASGVYFARLQAGVHRSVVRVTLVR